MSELWFSRQPDVNGEPEFEVRTEGEDGKYVRLFIQDEPDGTVLITVTDPDEMEGEGGSLRTLLFIEVSGKHVRLAHSFGSDAKVLFEADAVDTP
jgi:hypothetical protein